MSKILSDELLEEKIHEFQRQDKYIETENPWCAKPVMDHWNLKVDSRYNVKLLPQVWSDTEYVDWDMSKFSVIFSDEEILNQYTSMTEEINDLYKYVKSIGKAHLKELDEGLYVIVWNPCRNLFVRGTILSSEELSEKCEVEDATKKPEECHVHAFDFDEYLCVTKRDVFPICTQFLKLLPQAVPITLDGLEKFSRSLHLKDIIQQNETWKEYQYLEWTILVTRIKLETAMCKMNPIGWELDETTHNFNFDLLETIWATCTEPNLPEVNESRLQAFIVNYEEDGRIGIQFESPYHSLFETYTAAAKKKLQELVLNHTAFKEFVAPLPLDPNEIYMSPYYESQGPEGYEFFRAKVLPENRENLKEGEVRLKFIDYGNEEIGTASQLVVASKIHHFLGMVPPMCVEANMANVHKLDTSATAQTGIISDVIPFLITTVEEADMSNGKLGIVRVYREAENEEFDRQFEDLSSYLFSLRLATENPKPSSKSTKKSKVAKSVIPTDKTITEFHQSTYIEMKDWRKNFNLGSRSFLPASSAGPGEKKKVEEESNKIYFKIGRVQSPQDFTIKAIDSKISIKCMSNEIKKHISTSWYTLGKTLFDLDSFTTRWFYGLHWAERNLYCRVRFVRYLEPTRQTTSKAKVLLVDFAEYKDVELWELERTIPLDICKIPPQAVAAKLCDDFLDIFHPNKTAMEEEKTETFRKKFSNKIVCGEVKYCQPDKMELTTVFFKNVMNTEKAKTSKKKTTN